MIEHSLKTAISSAWSHETASDAESWSEGNPAAGHCDVSSLVLREHVGGDLRMAQVFRNGQLSEHHYWNRLPDGSDLDLTAAQFDGTETFGPATEMDAAFFAEAPPIRPELFDRLDRFRSAVDAAIAGQP